MRPDRMPDDALSDEAALWFARMRGPGASADRPAFEAWLATSPAHREAYDWIAQVFDLGVLIEVASDPAPAAAPPRTHHRQRQTALIATLLLVVGAGGWALLAPRPDAAVSVASRDTSMSGRQMVTTDVGQIRTVLLADGSRVTLDTGSAVALAYARDIRRLTLLRGRARFDVAHESRPFVVAAGNGTVTAHGTVFDVGMSSGGAVMVRLLRGAVDVALPARAGSGPPVAATTRRLAPGQQVAMSASALSGVRTIASPDDRWPQGVLDCDGMTLADVVARANRYATTQVALGDPGLGALKVSGTFRIDTPALLAGQLATVFGLETHAQGPTRIVIGRGRLREIKSPAPS